MKAVYPIIITPPEKADDYFIVYIPDFDINTEGKSMEEALYMARDAIGLMGITMEDEGKAIPKAATFKPNTEGNELVALIDIDFKLYREQQDNRTVRKNCTIPMWLNRRAEEKHVNFSAVLQEALKSIIGY